MRLLPRSLSRRLWRGVALFAYRRWAEPGGRKPVGLPFNRDPDNPCTAYEPRTWQLGDWNDCLTDRHHLCYECCRRAPTRDGINNASGAVVFAATKPTTVEQIDQWFYEFVGNHIARHPRADWPSGDFDLFRAVFGPWKAAFVRLGIDRYAAELASGKLATQPQLHRIGDHLPALIRLAGKDESGPDVVTISLWGPTIPDKGAHF